jgi:hypothetical protein
MIPVPSDQQQQLLTLPRNRPKRLLILLDLLRANKRQIPPLPLNDNSRHAVNAIPRLLADRHLDVRHPGVPILDDERPRFGLGNPCVRGGLQQRLV